MLSSLSKIFLAWTLGLTLVYAEDPYTPQECLNSKFITLVQHPGRPFGLTDNLLRLTKDECILTIEHTKWKFVKSQWTIDVCRHPVHVKEGAGAVEVLKRDGNCAPMDPRAKVKPLSSEYCSNVIKLLDVVQDDGLIFAKGEKQYLSTDHGKVYCSYTLMKKYLSDGVVSDRFAQTGHAPLNHEPAPVVEEKGPASVENPKANP